MSRSPRVWLVIVVLIALIGRVLLLASNTVSFHSDEAVVGLMARHILQGERPVFFYGQAYMGSLDAWLIALGFSVLGESVLTIRIVQSIMYLLTVATGFAVAWRISGRMVVATVTGLVLAVPNVLLALYTTATLGGYNETLLLGNLLLLLGWDVTHEHRKTLWRWLALGICAGVGWWTNGLIIAFILPVSLLILWEMWRNVRAQRKDARAGVQLNAPTGIVFYILPVLLGLIGFLLGSAPWWAFNFAHDFAALRFYLPSSGTPSEFAGNDIAPLPTDQRLIGLFLLGLPAVVGLRFPWQPDFFLLPVGIVVLLVYAFACYRLLRHNSELKPDGRLLVVSMIGLFCGLFIVSRFSIDPTGRYFLPLTLPLAILLATLVSALRQAIVRAVLVALVLGYATVGVVTAVSTMPPGMTTQFNLETHIPHDDDAALIAFLDEHGLYHGYTNYWVSFRLAFLSGDRMQYSAVLPYKSDLSYTRFDNRYAPYVAATENAPPEQIAYITANVAAVKDALEASFAAQSVTYQYAQVGVYHVYYAFVPDVPSVAF